MSHDRDVASSGPTAITRVWHGWTTSANADAYQRLLLTTVVPGIAARKIPGYLGMRVDRREVPDGVEFVTTMHFTSIAAVVAFAGADYARSVVPPAALALLARHDAEATHYDVVVSVTAADGGDLE